MKKESLSARIRAIFTDIDGTLLDSNESVSARNLEAISRAIAEGYHMVFASGRSTLSIRNLFREIRDEDFNAIAFNGSEITIAGNTIFRRSLEAEMASRIAAKAIEKEIHIHAYAGEDLVFSDLTPTAVQYAIHTGLKLLIVGDLVSFLETHPPTKLLIVSQPDKLADIRDTFSAEYPDINFTRSGEKYLDVTCPDVDKGRALLFICDLLKVSPQETIAFGDNDNDVEMLKMSGIAVAMANGSKELKAIASIIAPSNDEDGFSRVIEELLFD